MSVDQQLPQDPAAAAEILAALPAKDADDTVCRYPTCHQPRVPVTGTGRPGAYCSNPDHTALTNHRARQHLRAIAARTTTETTASVDRPVLEGLAPVESLRRSVVNQITHLRSGLDHYVATLTRLADPELSAAQIQAAIDRAEARVAEAQQSASTERSLRLAAETACAAAQEEARTEREAAEQAIRRMEEAEERAQQMAEEQERHLVALQTEHARELERLRTEMQQRQEAIQQQASEALAAERAATVAAQQQAREAEARAGEAEREMRAQTAIAERLVQEAQTALERERAEVDRLRTDLTESKAEARARAEADRQEARTTLERERAEVDRLRTDLAAAYTRVEQLTASNDQLRTQWLQLQAKSEKSR
jgi:colicin import membrane protein